MKKVSPLFLFISISAFAGLALAHHSAAIFDSTKLVILKGTTLKFTNMNPHAWISVEARVNGTGESERWDVETTAPIQLVTMGITSNTLKPGDKVTIGIRPLRDGRRAGALVFLVTADGVAHGANPSDLGLDIATLKP